jgi:Nucleoside 2-deoxyribosyltransferase
VADKLVELLERFFLDLVATITPGILFFFGLFLVLGHAPFNGLALPISGDSRWWIWLPLAYATGHVLTGIGNWLVVPLWLKLSKGRFKTILIPAEYENVDSIRDRPSVSVIKKEIPALRDIDLANRAGRSSLRNIAFTAVGSENISTIIRFTAISLLCLNVAVVTLILAIVYFSPRLWDAVGVISVTASTGRLLPVDMSLASQLLGTLGIVLLVVLTMMRRHLEFWSRSQYLQYDMLAGIVTAQRAGLLPKQGAPEDRSLAPQKDATLPRRPIVYLSGGQRSGWQQEVRAEVPQLDYLDPSAHHIEQADAYTAWDLAAVRACDLVFAYLEITNPSGYGLSVEIGYARALGKVVVLVDEKSESDPRLERRLRIVRATASVVFFSFADGVDYLRDLAGLPRL